MLKRVQINGYAKFDESDRLSPLPTSKGEIDEVGFFEVQLLKDDLCGTGSYGKVCKAMVDQLVCAAKIIHSTFFAEIDPSCTKTMLQFQKECEFMSQIRHPCIVQYLGTTQDIETGLPVLLMELMDESLTQFLSRTVSEGETVPYHKVVNICHDVAMALAFLHSNGIVHRDLSSNNVLMVAGEKAKVSDFGMAKLMDAKHSHILQLTQCPGTYVYMPPEALRSPPTYTAKLDIFSVGVVLIQVITGCFPSPGNAKRTVTDSRHGTVEVPIPEQERRAGDLAGIPEGHQLLGTILDCLADFQVNRLSSKDLCHRMIYYKSCQEYKDSNSFEERRKKQCKMMEEELYRKNQDIRRLQAKLDKANSTWEKSLQNLEEEKDMEIAQLRAELEEVKYLGEVMQNGSVMKMMAGKSCGLNTGSFISHQSGPCGKAMFLIGMAMHTVTATINFNDLQWKCPFSISKLIIRLVPKK